MRVLAKYTGSNPAFTKGAKYSFDLKPRRLGHKIDITSVERSNKHSKPGYEVTYLNLAEFLVYWQIQALTLSAAETTDIKLREDIFPHSWLEGTH